MLSQWQRHNRRLVIVEAVDAHLGCARDGESAQELALADARAWKEARESVHDRAHQLFVVLAHLLAELFGSVDHALLFDHLKLAGAPKEEGVLAGARGDVVVKPRLPYGLCVRLAPRVLLVQEEEREDESGRHEQLLFRQVLAEGGRVDKVREPARPQLLGRERCGTRQCKHDVRVCVVRIRHIARKQIAGATVSAAAIGHEAAFFVHAQAVELCTVELSECRDQARVCR